MLDGWCCSDDDVRTRIQASLHRSPGTRPWFYYRGIVDGRHVFSASASCSRVHFCTLSTCSTHGQGCAKLQLPVQYLLRFVNGVNAREGFQMCLVGEIMRLFGSNWRSRDMWDCFRTVVLCSISTKVYQSLAIKYQAIQS